MSGVKEYTKASKDMVNIADIAGGSGRQGRIIKKLVGEDSKKVTVYEIDIDRVELRKGKGGDKIIGEAIHLPLKDKSMDFVFMNNIPVPLLQVRNHIFNMKDNGSRETALEMLENAIDAQYNLLLLEGARGLKEKGVMMLAAKQTGQSMGGFRRPLRICISKWKRLNLLSLRGELFRYGRNMGLT